MSFSSFYYQEKESGGVAENDVALMSFSSFYYQEKESGGVAENDDQ
jgi:hypothetical protein